MTLARRLAHGAVILLAGAATGTLAGMWGAQRPPVVLSSVKEADGVVIRGGWIDLDVTVSRSRICDTKVERWLWRDMEGQARRWVPLAPAAAPPVHPGTKSVYRLSLPIPGNLPPGRWFYFSRTRDDCGSMFSTSTVRDSPNIPLEIVDPPQSAPLEVVAPPGPVVILPTFR